MARGKRGPKYRPEPLRFRCPKCGKDSFEHWLWSEPSPECRYCRAKMVRVEEPTE